MKYISIRQAAEILELSIERVRNKIFQKKRKCFPGAIKPGHDWLLPYDEVIAEKKYRDEESEKLEAWR